MKRRVGSGKIFSRNPAKSFVHKALKHRCGMVYTGGTADALLSGVVTNWFLIVCTKKMAELLECGDLSPLWFQIKSCDKSQHSKFDLKV
ncbi:MAG: hypothetical protein AB1631_27255 [Acidobacteriota bacterium]